MSNKYIVGGIAFILVIAGGYYVLKGMKSGARAASEKTGSPSTMVVGTTTFATTTFSVVYPADYTVNAAFSNTEVNPKKPIAGVQFSLPGSMATGTTLLPGTFISVEQLPRAKNCTGDIYLAANVKPTTETVNGVTYSVAANSGGGSGHIIDEKVYAVSGSSPCTAVRYYIDSAYIENYDPGTIREYDKAALIAAFDKIRDSLVLVR